MKKITALLIIVSLVVSCSNTLQPDEHIAFYPTTARTNEAGQIEARIEAWVYEQEERPGISQAFATWLDLDVASLSAEEQKVYRERTQLFRFDSERNKSITLSFDKNTARQLPDTNRHGRISTSITLDNFKASVLPDWIHFRAQLTAADTREFNGKVLLLPAQGLSVISDIDDTIKNSNVLQQRELLLNTFVRPFKSVAGMANYYQRLSQRNDGISFHYVTSSPRQLFPVLDTFLQEHSFPAGTLHLRDIRLSEEIFGDGESSKRHKQESIRRLLHDFPQRRFILIGDSGELDPEIYRALAQEFPEQVMAIYIRDVTGQTRDDERYTKLFQGVDVSLWRIFTDPQALPVNE